MSKEWYLIQQPYYTEGSEKPDLLFDSEMSFNDVLEDSVIEDDIILCSGVFDGKNFENEFATKGIIQNEIPDTPTQAWQRQVLTYISTISDYKYIKYDNKIWLILTEPTNNKLYEKSILYLCNYVIKWQDENGIVHYKPCNIQNASQYNSGTNETKVITIGYDQLMMYISLDEETKYFPHDKRFFIDYNDKEPTPYRITRPDTVSFSFGNGRCMHIILSESQYNPQTDRIDLMLCDYFKPNDATKPVEISYSGNAEIRCGGTVKTFTAKTDKSVTWSLKLLDKQQDFITMIVNENKVKIKCLNNNALIGSSFKLVCTVGDVLSELLINIVGGV